MATKLERKIAKVGKDIGKVLREVQGWTAHRMVMGHGWRIEHPKKEVRQRIATLLVWSDVDGDINLDSRYVYVCVLA